VSAWATRFATFFGIGWTPYAPGTAASAAALPFGFLLVLSGWKAVAVFSALATVLGIWACGVHAKRKGVRDPSECVLDEVAGQWLALFPIALGPSAFAWRPYVAAFLLFRALDMLKPWPVGEFERLPGGLGIMMDDVAAGVIAAGVLYGIMAIDLI
jgi:phosphatidylglycerophosphatase A